PDGRRIAFLRQDRANPYVFEIYLINADGSGQRMLTRNFASRDFTPVWSPGGRQIVFLSRRNGKSEVHMINTDGTGRRNLTREWGLDGFPVWSADGRKIAFFRERRGIYVMNADGNGERRLT